MHERPSKSLLDALPGPVWMHLAFIYCVLEGSPWHRPRLIGSRVETAAHGRQGCISWDEMAIGTDDAPLNLLHYARPWVKLCSELKLSPTGDNSLVRNGAPSQVFRRLLLLHSCLYPSLHPLLHQSLGKVSLVPLSLSSWPSSDCNLQVTPTSLTHWPLAE